MRNRTSTLPLGPRVHSPPDSMDFHEDESLLSEQLHGCTFVHMRVCMCACLFVVHSVY